MKDFGIYMFNPQPEPPGAPDQFANRPDNGHTHLEYKLDRVTISSYSIHGS